MVSDLEMVNGVLPVPTRPGLGVELDHDALLFYADTARRLDWRR